jgi:hypothetical protein
MSSSSWINLDALWKIVVFGLLLGAGLPALFAIGLRALSGTESAEAAGGSTGAATAGVGLAAKAFAVLCFAAILAAIGWGIYEIVNQS